MPDAGPYDVIVVGAGNAALCAALAAQEKGAKVLVLEKASEEERGGNSTFTAGGFRFVHHGVDDLHQPGHGPDAAHLPLGQGSGHCTRRPAAGADPTSRPGA